MNWLVRRKYRVLLLCLLLLMVVLPLLRSTSNTRLILESISTLVFLAALWVIFNSPKLRLVALLLGVPTLIGQWTGYFLPGRDWLVFAVGFHLLAALFFGFAIGVILHEIQRERGVSTDSVFGAFCGYILAGLMFGHLYSVLELFTPGSFLGEGFTNRPQPDHHFLLTYFSFLTLTTVGYGDIIPGSDLARGLAVVEAVTGQFYLAVLVAELIGKRVSQAFATSHNPPNSQSPPP